MSGQFFGLAGAEGEESSLAAEVLQVSGLLAQEASSQGGQYIFQVEDVESIFGGGRFELTRDDTLHLIGLLNSPEVDIAKRELGVLLSRLGRPAVEGLTRRLFSALRRRTTEMADLEEKNLNITQKGSPTPGVRRAQVRRPVRNEVPPQQSITPPAPSMPQQQSKSEEQLRPMQLQRPPARQAVAARVSMPPAEAYPPPVFPPVPQRPQRITSKRDEMPQVFRRLTELTSTGISGDEVLRGARAGLSSPPGSPSPPLTIGGIPSNDGGPQASAYLEALLEAHECETGIPATSSRRPMLAEDIEPSGFRSPRVPEEKAKEIFDRLYKSGKEHRVRRRVYHELGLLVEQAKEAQTCTFEPRLPLASYPGGQPGEGSVTDRLYREGLDRIRRREELMQSAPVPTFRPQTMGQSSSMSGLRRPQQQQPMDNEFLPIAREGIQQDAEIDEDGILIEPDGMDQEDRQYVVEEQRSMQNKEPAHLRLFRLHQEKLERQRDRQDSEADWRKHAYRPDVSRSQISGPQVVRSSSYAAMPQSMMEDDEFGQTMVATANDETGDPSLAALATDVLATPRSGEGEGDGAQALLLVFSDARMPVPDGFEEELINGLALLGADCLEEVSLSLLDGECIVAEIQGPREALTLLRELHLFDLTVSGLRVSEVRLASVADPVYGEDGNPLNQDIQIGNSQGDGTELSLPGGALTARSRASTEGVPEPLLSYAGASSTGSPRASQAGGSPRYSVASIGNIFNAGSQTFMVPRKASSDLIGTGVVSIMSGGRPSGGSQSGRVSLVGTGVERQISGQSGRVSLVGTGVERQISGPYVKSPGSLIPEPGYTLSREASAATFNSNAIMTPTSADPGVQRLYSGRLSTASQQNSMVLSPGGGGPGPGDGRRQSGTGVRYPAELANMPSALGNYGGAPGASMGSPRLSEASSQYASGTSYGRASQFGSQQMQLGSQHMQLGQPGLTAPSPYATGAYGYGSQPVGGAYGGQPMGGGFNALTQPQRPSYPQMMRAAY